jgi:UDP-glucose 4-epimerase
MRVLVTGGAGFIGSHLTDAFLARGDTVTVVDDLSHGRAGRLDPAACLHTLTVCDAPSLAAVFQASRPEVVCHLAAQVDVRASVAAPGEDARANVVGTVNVLGASRAVGAPVIFASSGGAVYGRAAPVPADEGARAEPDSPYGLGKYCAERYASLFNRLHDTRNCVLRLSNVYGPRQSPEGEAGVISILCGRAVAGCRPTVFGDGLQTRDYVYVGDVVEAFLAAADAGRPGTWNVGTGVQTSVLDLVAAVARLAGRPLPPVFAAGRPGETPRSAVAAGLIARDLGWRPRVALADGITRVYQWIENGAADRARC